jgi:hypothetical protein
MKDQNVHLQKDAAIEVQHLINGFLFLSIKYGRALEDAEFYRRFRNMFSIMSAVGEQIRDSLCDDAKQEQGKMELCPKDIRDR